MIDERLCGPHSSPVNRFEDFGSLLRVSCENHTRKMSFSALPNPAPRVRAELPDLEQLSQVQELTSEITAAAVRRMPK
jgi:hypothetical protein